MNIKLYKQDVSGTIRVWEIGKADDNHFAIMHGTYGGLMQERFVYVSKGLGGRTLGEQIMLRMASLISKKRDMGYVNSIYEAMENRPTNTLSLPLPMLAKPLKDAPLPDEYFLQYKYDGNRCMITKKNGEMIAYSRKGKLITSIDHILEKAKHIPEGFVLDGELYKHGVSLQTLRSWISKKQADSMNLEYMCYDCINEELPFEKRLSELYHLDLSYPIRIAETSFVTPSELRERGIGKRLEIARDKGYEGLIARHTDGMYVPGKRSKELVKIKMWYDDEFLILDIVPSADNWAILECAVEYTPKTFRVSAPGSLEEKKEILLNKDKYIGQKVTVEYANVTKDRMPFHPVALAFRLPTE